MIYCNYKAVFELLKPFSESHDFDVSNRYSSENNFTRDASLVSFESSHSSREAPCTLFLDFDFVGVLWSLEHKKNARFSDRTNEIHLKMFLKFESSPFLSRHTNMCVG